MAKLIYIHIHIRNGYWVIIVATTLTCYMAKLIYIYIYINEMGIGLLSSCNHIDMLHKDRPENLHKREGIFCI